VARQREHLLPQFPQQEQEAQQQERALAPGEMVQ